jgi:hypothetical protein
MLKTYLATKTVKSGAKAEKCIATTEWYNSAYGKQKQVFS